MAIKGVNEDREQIKDLSRELQEHHRKLLVGRNAVVKLFDNLLTEATWNNHDSRRLKRHYTKLDERFGQDLEAFRDVSVEALSFIEITYGNLEEGVAGLFGDSFWRETLKK